MHGDFIRIEYVGRISDTKEIFDLTNEQTARKEGIYNEKIKYKPAPVIVGEGFVIKGIENELLKMNVGEKRTIFVTPEEGFGKRRPDLVKVVPITFFRKQGVNPAPGLVVNVSGLIGRIQSCESGRVRLDFNSPLAGKNLEYEIEIRERVVDNIEKAKMIMEIFNIPSNISIKEDSIEIEIGKIDIQTQIKERIAHLMKKYLKVEKVKFIEVF